MAGPVVYIGSIDKAVISQLLSYTAQIINDSTINTVRAKCREIVRSNSLLLAGPIDSNSLCIICKPEYFSSMSKETLSKLNIRVINEGCHVTLSLLKLCYEFTIKSRLSPKWNEIHEWLVKGNDVFITGKTLAIKLDININSNQIILSITPLKIIFKHLKPIDLEVPTSTLTLFNSDINAIIKEESISTNQCCVLPNLTSAYVYSLSHVAPSTGSQFNSYDKIRHYWKKQYGFILPESQSLFYQIFFSFNPSSFFSYPGCCIIRGRPLVVPFHDKNEINESFINDVHSRIPTLCGNRVQYKTMPLSLMTTLTSSSVTSTTLPPNTKPVAIAMKKGPVMLGLPNLPPISQQLSAPLGANAAPLGTNTGANTAPLGTNTGANTAPLGANAGANTGANTAPLGANTGANTAPLGTNTGANTAPLGTNTGANAAPLGTNTGANTAPLVRRFTKKRRLEGEDDCPKAKRLQVVPDINDDHEACEYSISSIDEIKIQKSKVSALKAWLQENNVKHNSRDKKETLIKLVRSHVLSTGITF